MSQKADIYRVLQKQSLTASQIAAELGLKTGSVSAALSELSEQRRVQPVGYSFTEGPRRKRRVMLWGAA